MLHFCCFPFFLLFICTLVVLLVLRCGQLLFRSIRFKFDCIFSGSMRESHNKRSTLIQFRPLRNNLIRVSHQGIDGVFFYNLNLKSEALGENRHGYKQFRMGISSFSFIFKSICVWQLFNVFCFQNSLTIWMKYSLKLSAHTLPY